MIPNYIFFAPNFFNFEIILALIIFENFVASKVFTFTFHCAMPHRYPVYGIRHTADQVEDLAVVCYVRLWDRDQDGYLWVHPSVVINITPGSGNISTNIQTTKGKVVLITVSCYGLLVDVVDC